MKKGGISVPVKITNATELESLYIKFYESESPLRLLFRFLTLSQSCDGSIMYRRHRNVYVPVVIVVEIEESGEIALHFVSISWDDSIFSNTSKINGGR